MSVGERGSGAGEATQKRVRKQAIVVIHGIGEQEPMATLRSLVFTLVGHRQYSKPDRMSGSHELRRLRAMDPMDLGDRWLESDFYELYWAHEIRDTKLSSVVWWLFALAFRRVRPGHVHARRIRAFKAAALALTVGLIAAAWLIWRYRTQLEALPVMGGVLLVVGLIGLPRLRSLLLLPIVTVVGDAARYLSPKPENVQARQRIRESGIALLEKLHADENVERVVLVGHSLGSVIAYDVLCDYWALVHVDVPVPKAALDAITRAGEALTAADLAVGIGGDEGRGGAAEPAETNGAAAESHVERAARREAAQVAFHAAQGAAFDESLAFATKPRATSPGAEPLRAWRVTDLLTLGSPLAYADFMRAATPAGHAQDVAHWEAPTCPPEPNWDWDAATGDYRMTRPNRKAPPGQFGTYGYQSAGDKRYRWHHAAVFALTRWTNLYYPGDVIGGAVGALFGPGVHDAELEAAPGTDEPATGLRFLRWPHRPDAHVRYWHAGRRAPLTASAEWLREVVFRRAGGEPPSHDEREVRPVNRSTGRYDVVPEHVRGDWGGA